MCSQRGAASLKENSATDKAADFGTSGTRTGTRRQGTGGERRGQEGMGGDGLGGLNFPRPDPASREDMGPVGPEQLHVPLPPGFLSLVLIWQ